ncbi:hypothetical protein RB195_003186 [Necator americanus]|uniref:Uncharacterized protein n=1 Tax=Necator americanus TaxID=51031 RepID=A0ABR1DQ62_NECAM
MRSGLLCIQLLNKAFVVAPIVREDELRVYSSDVAPIGMYGSKTWPVPSTVMGEIDGTDSKLPRLTFV